MASVTTTTPPPRISSQAHQLYRLLIDSLLDRGTLPEPPELAGQLNLSPGAVEALTGELADRDWIGVDSDGAIVAMYPFSPTPTGITVRIDDLERDAMCALDALGIAPMLRRTIDIRTDCGLSGEPLAITVTPTGISSTTPAEIAVVRRLTPGTAHINRCGATRFFGSGNIALEWIKTHGRDDDIVVSLETAFQAATVRFGACYSGTSLTLPCDGDC